MNVRIRKQETGHSANDHSKVQLASRPRFFLILAIAISLTITTPVCAQTVTGDTSANPLDTAQKKAKLGARFTLGGLYAFGLDDVEQLSDIHHIYGIRAGGLFPVGAQCDLTADVTFLQYPGWTYTIPPSIFTIAYYALSPPHNSTPPDSYTIKVPDSQLGSVRIGVRLYARTKNTDALINAMSPRWQRDFWRKRVDRRGFYFGLNTGPVVGWHKRIIRTLPVDWPVNVPIPESAMEQNEQVYTRWYLAVNPEFGWIFNGRVDLALGFGVVTPLQSDTESAGDVDSDTYTQTMLSAHLSYILGRTGL